jgi:hypothetical protein
MDKAVGMVRIILKLKGDVYNLEFPAKRLLNFFLYHLYVAKFQIALQFYMSLQVYFLISEHPGMDVVDV